MGFEQCPKLDSSEQGSADIGTPASLAFLSIHISIQRWFNSGLVALYNGILPSVLAAASALPSGSRTIRSCTKRISPGVLCQYVPSRLLVCPVLYSSMSIRVATYVADHESLLTP